MTSLALTPRAASGLSSICMRPLLRVVLVPSTPMKEDRDCTAGSCRTTWARARCRVVMASKLVASGAWEMAWMRPVSWMGKKPLGMATYSQPVATRVRAAIPSTRFCRTSTQVRLRP